MKPKKAIKELRKQLKGDQGNVVVKIRLASLLRDVGEYGEAVHLYLAVAQAYLATDRLGQAIAVCKGILEFAPNDPATHQMWAYLEQSRQLAEAADAAESPSPPVQSYPSSFPDESRRKRPTSFPTPLSDGGPVSPMPGMPSTPGHGQRAHRPSEPALATGPQRNARPTETGHTLSPRRLEPDVTLPGAPPTRPTNEFKLRDLSAAGTARPAETAQHHDEALTLQKIPKLMQTLRMPLSDSAPGKSVRPPPPPPPAVGAASRASQTDTHTVPHGRAVKPTFRPRDLAPAPTPIPADMISPPPLLDQAEPMDENSEPGLEDATIVDANFDMAKFILSQAGEEHDPSDADLPEIPIRATTQEVTRVAELEPVGVAIEKLGPLRRLSEYALKALAAGATENDYPTGYMILSEGDGSDTCYVVVSGEVQVLKRNAMKPGAPIKEVARLGPGALFGEYALVGDRRCLASVQTTVPSIVVEIPRSVIASLTGRFPALRSSLELLYREILIESLMSSSRLFRVLVPEEWPEVLGLFEPVRAAVGQSIIQEGQRFGGFYLVLTGEVSVAGGGREAIRGLGAGFYVGEVSMLKGELARATVTAETSVEFARLDARRFYSLVAGNERLWAHIWQESQRPEFLALQLVAGVAANV